MKPYVITIARQYGSGGKTVGKMLADKLGIPFYNREIITMASEDSGVNAMPTIFWQADRMLCACSSMRTRISVSSRP